MHHFRVVQIHVRTLTKDPDEIIRTVQILEPSFGGINLEDIAQPKCFRILDALRDQMQIPIWHDDQQGTATVTNKNGERGIFGIAHICSRASCAQMIVLR